MVSTRRGALALVFVASSCGRTLGTRGEGPQPATLGLAEMTADAAPPPPASAPASASAPFGTSAPVPRYTCPQVLSGGPFRSFIATPDTRVSFVAGDDLLALVNRSPTGALPPGYAPTDLVDLRDGKPRTQAECESARPCLRDEAAKALARMLEQMRSDGVRGHVQSAFRGFGTQCWVFSSWARQARGGFCEATEQSALPGHSQHQLGTTLDLFTEDWAQAGAKTGQGVFRNGFGCSPGGLWIDQNSWRYGFVVPYPIDPDDRKNGSRCLTRSDRPVPIDPKTGYKHEPWHVRYIGRAEAARYHDAWLASAPGTPGEITLEQWIRAQRGLPGDTELPVCDGCTCGARATLASEGDKGACGDASLLLDGSGRVVAPADEPTITSAHVTPAKGASDGAIVVSVTVHAPHTPTQTPVATADGPTYTDHETFASLMTYPGGEAHRYEDLPGAWRVAVESVPSGPVRWPWRASIARDDLAATWNRANIVLPAKAGDVNVAVRVVMPKGARGVNVTLLRDGKEHGVVHADAP